jgi:acyl-coenzyme A thioesterase PaaI-like protein
MPRITAQEIYQLCEESLPWAGIMGFEITEIGKGSCRVRLPHYSMYVAVLSAIGRVEMAVTTSLNCNFLRRPEPGAVIAECRLLKLGKRLAYGEVSLYTEGAEADGPVAHVTATYSIPPAAGGGG